MYRNFLNRPVVDGIFVEVGAFDGKQGSNTKFFEDNLGYTGALIEPIPACIPKIMQNRKSLVYNYAIHPSETTVKFVGASAVAGIVDEMSEKHKQEWFPDMEESNIVEVPAAPLASILHHANISHIDFLSIDVEGGELLVLQSIDWPAVEIYVICIELDGTNPAKDEACREILRSQGFTFQLFLGNNDIWLNTAYSKRGNRYDPNYAPYNANCLYFNAETQCKLANILESYTPPPV